MSTSKKRNTASSTIEIDDDGDPRKTTTPAKCTICANTKCMMRSSDNSLFAKYATPTCKKKFCRNNICAAEREEHHKKCLSDYSAKHPRRPPQKRK